MALQWHKSTRAFTFILTLLLALPAVSQAASDEDLAALRAQIKALSQRLDQLEAENRKLAASNSDLQRSGEETAKTVAEISAKTESEAASWTDKIQAGRVISATATRSFDIEGKSKRDRNRIRARAAMIAEVTPTVTAGFGLASGSDDPVSTNQTLGSGGSSKNVVLDLAYVDWSGLANTHVIGGKFSNFLHKSSLIWDGDWRPEGGGFKFANGDVFVNGIGTWIESDKKLDQLLAWGLQGGVKMPLGDAMKLTAGASYYQLNTQGKHTFHFGPTDFFGNSYDPATNTYMYDYKMVELFADLGMDLADRPLKVYGDYVQNRDGGKYDTGYQFGVQYGKAADAGQWQVGYIYEKLEADAVFGLLTDSDFGGGGTDSKGHIFKASYALAKHANFDVTYFINKSGIRSGDPIDFKRLQVDLAFKY